ncbi:MAG: hypothetical protein AAGF93_01670 [Cyanobacteria bacterium P01_H01_bin.105]
MKTVFKVLTIVIATSLLSIPSTAHAYSEDGYSQEDCDNIIEATTMESERGTLTEEKRDAYGDSLYLCLNILGVRAQLENTHFFQVVFKDMWVLNESPIYENPTSTEPAIGSLYIGDKVHVLQMSKAFNREGIWFQIVIPRDSLDGTGWIHESAFRRNNGS